MKDPDDINCMECWDAGYYTTEGSKEACEAAGLTVLEDGQDGTCLVRCPRCPCRQQRRQALRKFLRDCNVDNALTTAAQWSAAWTRGHNRQERRFFVKARRRRNDGRLKKFPTTISRVRSAR